MPQTTSHQSEPSARAHLIDNLEQAGLELIQIAGVARARLKPVPSDLLDDLMAAIECAQRSLLRYRQQHEIETTPQQETA